MNALLPFLAAALAAIVSPGAVPPAGFSLDNVFADHMVLQRGKPLRFSGWADPGTRVTCSFHGRDVTAAAGADGRWLAELPPEEAGGPYDLRVTTDRSTAVRLADILVGDVWICSGQSNMEMPVWGPGQHYRRLDGKAFAASFKDSRMRLLQVPKAVGAGAPFAELSGRPAWRVADAPDAIEPFSFTGFSFGQALRAEMPDVPIGLVNASWGGTLIEPWIPYSAYRAGGEAYADVVAAIAPVLLGDRSEAAVAAKVREQTERTRRTLLAWVARFNASAPEATARARAAWGAPDLDTSDWKTVTPDSALGLSEPGVAWYRFAFDAPAAWVGQEAVFHLDYVNDADETFLDGAPIGATGPGTMTTDYWCAPRDYRFTVPSAGRHVIAVRAQDHYGAGGLGENIRLTGPDAASVVFGRFLEKVEFRADVARLGERPPVPSVGGNIWSNPQTWTALYNTMIHPLAAMNVKGVIWYQGCSNAPGWRNYPALQRLQIDAWRAAFRDPDLPFVITQLAAFYEHKPERRPAPEWWKGAKPSDFGFAHMRDAQMDAATNCPSAGIACAIDIGEMYDIHPKNKQEVGRRLAHEALRLAYGRAEAAPGPTVASAVREGRAVRVTFAHVGKGLYAKGGAISANVFALADAAGNSVWADAALAPDGSVLVSSPAMECPAEVRYAYTGFPHAPNLYRTDDDLPVYPFRRAVR